MRMRKLSWDEGMLAERISPVNELSAARFPIRTVDPTLPRYGTDFMPLEILVLRIMGQLPSRVLLGLPIRLAGVS